ncbi:TPA: hypothetical protein ACOFD8_000575 [Stenotrophomonas maltophilia]
MPLVVPAAPAGNPEQIAEDLREHFGWEQPEPIRWPMQLELFVAA